MDDEKKSLRTPVEIGCREDIINLPDIATLRDLKSQWNVESDGPLQSRDDYIRLLLRVYDQRHERTHKVRIVSQSVVNIILILYSVRCAELFCNDDHFTDTAIVFTGRYDFSLRRISYKLAHNSLGV